MGKNPVDRVKTLLGKLDSKRRSEERGSSIIDGVERLSGKFAGQVGKIFDNLPKSLEWQSFSRHDRLVYEVGRTDMFAEESCCKSTQSGNGELVASE